MLQNLPRCAIITVAHLLFWGGLLEKILTWPIALTTSLVSLAAMCLFDYILSLIYYFIGKVPFLIDIIDYIGEILDLGLTVLIAMLIASSIWSFGLSLIKKIRGEAIEFQESPIYHINNMFLFVFLAMVIFLGYKFIMLIGGTVTSYTAGLGGFDKFLMLLKAIKDTYIYICDSNIVFYKIGSNSLILFAINIFGYKFVG